MAFNLPELKRTVGQAIWGLISPEYKGGPHYSLLQFVRFTALAQKAGLPIEGQRFLDLGCGPLKPFSTAALLYLTGAREVVAVDVQDYSNSKDIAFRLYGLLLCVAADATVITKQSQKQRETVYSRLSHFDLASLREGDLNGGLPKGIRHIVGDYRELSINDANFDICVSFSVFEHIGEIETVLASLYRNMTKNGAVFADIDYRDHRLYTKQASPWQYLVDDEDVSPYYINKLRHSAMAAVIKAAGFRLEVEELIRTDVPDEIKLQIHPRHRHWDVKDLSILAARVLLRKRRNWVEWLN